MSHNTRLIQNHRKHKTVRDQTRITIVKIQIETRTMPKNIETQFSQESIVQDSEKEKSQQSQ